MSLAAAIPTPEASELFAKAPRWFWKIGQAGQQLFLELWFRMGFKKGRMRVTDRELAEWCGRGIRWAQKALRQLLDAMIEGVPFPLIDRFRVYGNRNESGRVIEIVIDFARPEPKAATATPKAATATAPRKPSAPIPNIPPIPPTSPDHLVAAARTNAAAAETPHDELTPEQVAETERILAESRRRREAEARADAQAEERRAGRESAARHSREELLDQIKALAGRMGKDPGQPSGGSPGQPSGP